MSEKSSNFAVAKLKVMKIAILGQGNVGTNLHHAFALKHIQTELINSWDLSNLPLADVYIYAVADKALAEVASKVSAPKALHLHTSGTMPIDVFGADKPHAGVLYFFQSFSKESLVDDWSSIPVFIEGRNIDDVAAIYTLAQTLSDRIYECNQRDRERLHIAGVFANNYSNLMYRIAAEVLKGTQIPFEALLPLIDRTAEKVHGMSPRDAQTGPAQRGDEAVIQHHVEILKATPYAELYQALAALIEKERNR